ncbi:hypothetical protein VNI00_015490 [Paramarasmius palmivorus]|uniref:Uncharacterized protein n=1 Tax=Paramarasmius palmivorus TaxID=297713 RepID=A0AAW0BLD9_9AGAR
MVAETAQEREKGCKRHRTDDGLDSRKRRRHTRSIPPPRKWDSSDEDDEFIGPEPAAASSSHSYTNDYARKPDYDALQAELEAQRFREKLSSAFEEDEAYHAIEARFNSFAYVPMHWGGSGGREKQRVNFDDDGLRVRNEMENSFFMVRPKNREWGLMVFVKLGIAMDAL